PGGGALADLRSRPGAALHRTLPRTPPAEPLLEVPEILCGGRRAKARSTLPRVQIAAQNRPS
ncbi:MAG TPA: hypothetical protein VMO88_06935, partial [Acidimicrobiales bacterium]|nr:hypothetical protein [Acidimicrobiales bacterium]